MMNARLVALAFVTAAVTLCSTSAAQKPPDPTRQPLPVRDARPMTIGTQTITKPEDPAKVKATYELNGARVEITEGEFFDAYDRLSKIEVQAAGRAVMKERVYEHILAFAEARAMGLEATDEEAALYDPLARNPELAKAKWPQYEKAGLTKDAYALYQREVRSIQKLRDLFANNIRIRSDDVIEKYARDHQAIRLAFVEFPASRYAAELAANPPSDADLRKFWDTDRATQQQHITQANVTVEIISFDPKAATPSGAQEVQVTRDQALAYYRKNKPRLDTMLTPEQRERVYPTTKVPIDQIETPFSILMPLIVREIQLAGRIQEALAQAKQPGAELEAIATKLNLGFERIEKADRARLATEHARYGPMLFTLASALNAGEIAQDVRVEPDIQYVYKLVAKESASLPAFDAIKDKLLEPYVKSTALTRARTEAQAMRAYIDQQSSEEIRAEEEKLLAQADAAAEAEIKQRNVTEQKEKEAIQHRLRTPVMMQMRIKKESLAAKHFDAYAAKHGLEVVDSGPIELGLHTLRSSPQNEARTRSFLAANQQVRAMEPGQVTAVLTDFATETLVIAKMVERSQPDLANVPDGALLAAKHRDEQGQHNRSRWMYAEIMRRRDLREGPHAK